MDLSGLPSPPSSPHIANLKLEAWAQAGGVSAGALLAQSPPQCARTRVERRFLLGIFRKGPMGETAAERNVT